MYQYKFSCLCPNKKLMIIVLRSKGGLTYSDFWVLFKRKYSMDFYGTSSKLIKIHAVMVQRVGNIKIIWLRIFKNCKSTFNRLVLRVFIIFFVVFRSSKLFNRIFFILSTLRVINTWFSSNLDSWKSIDLLILASAATRCNTPLMDTCTKNLHFEKLVTFANIKKT